MRIELLFPQLVADVILGSLCVRSSRGACNSRRDHPQACARIVKHSSQRRQGDGASIKKARQVEGRIKGDSIGGLARHNCVLVPHESLDAEDEDTGQRSECRARCRWRVGSTARLVVAREAPPRAAQYSVMVHLGKGGMQGSAKARQLLLHLGGHPTQAWRA